MTTVWTDFQDRLTPLVEQGPQHVSELVDCVLDEAVKSGASDVHWEPGHALLTLRMRIDGVLQTVAGLPRDLAGNCIARLKVLAELLTYRQDVPQEGRIRSGRPGATEMRVSTFPTVHGERAVVRLFDPGRRSFELEELGLPDEVLQRLRGLLRETSGVLLLTGPSGSGKTTTIYACLSHLLRASQAGRHVVTLEDPVEVVLEGVSQSQINPAAGFDFARGLRSLLRQDPEVIMIGEIRDRETAEIAIEAGLTGHLVISTLHSGSACGVIGRLLEMDIPPYLLTSSLKGVVSQRLVRRLCPACARPPPANQVGQTFLSVREAFLSVPDSTATGSCPPVTPSKDRDINPGTGPAWEPAGCADCHGSGYRGRKLLAELLVVDDTLRRAILERCDTRELQGRVKQRGQRTLWDAARDALQAGQVSIAELTRTLGTGCDAGTE